MRVLHLIDSGGLYGAERMLLMLCQGLIDKGVSSSILSCGAPDDPEKPIEAEARRQSIPVKPWRMRPGLNLAGMREIWRYIQEQRVDLVHSHGYKFNILLALTRQTSRRIPAVATIHGYLNGKFPGRQWLYETLDRQCRRRLDRVVFVARQPRALARRECVIHNCIATGTGPAIHAGPAHRLAIIGRLSTEKGHDRALSALAMLRDSAPG
ncbi:MAG: glycosyltransferase, partial [Chromatiales bacterium]|nr:glycosyltransferase [Chromatiales bacterium]